MEWLTCKVPTLPTIIQVFAGEVVSCLDMPLHHWLEGYLRRGREFFVLSVL